MTWSGKYEDAGADTDADADAAGLDDPPLEGQKYSVQEYAVLHECLGRGSTQHSIGVCGDKSVLPEGGNP